jgi:hypothetical protein
MPLSNVLYNPTPETVEINWHRGVKIKLAPDEHVEISTEQMDDFRPGKPGSEEVQTLMHYKGVFLFDPERDYDVQALEALQESHRAKNAQYRDSVGSLRRERAAQGIAEDEAAFEEILNQMGLNALKAKIDAIKSRIDFYKEVVGEKKDRKSRTHQFDPEKTLFLVEGPPREFPSKAAKQLFKRENPELVSGDPAEPNPPVEESQNVVESTD